MFVQQAGERAAGELAALIGVNISGLPYFAIASSTASVQNTVSIEIDRRHANTRRLFQSITAAR